MNNNAVQLTSLRLLKSTSAGSVDGTVHRSLRNRGQVLSRPVQVAFGPTDSAAPSAMDVPAPASGAARRSTTSGAAADTRPP